MSLLDGLKDAMINPIFDSVTESDADAELDFELALEAAVDKHVELSDADVAAIMDDDNPDNIVADMGPKDESVSKIAEDAVDDDFKALEAMLDELNALEADTSDDDSVENTEPIEEGCGGKACEEEGDAEPEDDPDYVSLDSLLDSVFGN